MKAYLLLRNNKQTGPYSLEELQQMGLKPFDLVWIERKSSAWRYPAEIKELVAYTSSAENFNDAIIDNPAQKVVNISSAPALAKTGSDNVYDYDSLEISEKYIRHVVALKPSIDNTRIRTIKSNTSKNIVHVQVRDAANEEPVATSTAGDLQNVAPAINKSYIVLPEHRSAQDEGNLGYSSENGAIHILKGQHITDNKLEWAVLIIGAVSLLAIVYLLVTSPY
ncbi:MAG: DUF4339 domain-containing protein [Terrimonas sp.]|nr:DUF4339 domain-containing protein [Terrimonas sp.]OJY93565.1 MAG: hypothetical protein BGP13_04010 [Sphingobacteriales bacterium 40-81]